MKTKVGRAKASASKSSAKKFVGKKRTLAGARPNISGGRHSGIFG